MNNIEDLLEKIAEKDVIIPDKINYTISNTLKNKKQKRKIISFRKVFSTAIVTSVILVLSVGTYAANTGRIDKEQIYKWFGLSITDEIENYKQEITDQVIIFDNTSIELTSTFCNEGITILEFNIKLSEADYKKLKIGENAVTEDFIKSQEVARDNIEEQYSNGRISKKEYNEKINDLNTYLEQRKNSTMVPAISLNFEQKGGTYNYDVFNPNLDWYASIYVDDEPYYVKNWQRTEKLTDYEYKIYNIYSMSDDVLEGKEEFNISFENNKLVGVMEWKTEGFIGWRNDSQLFAKDIMSMNTMIPQSEIIDIPNNFEVTVSKKDILKDSKILENLDLKSSFRNITHTVERVVITPVQTIITINHSATNQSSKAYANRYDDPNIEHLPLPRRYVVYDANGKELSCFDTSNKRTLIYANGTREDYDTHDIPTKKYDNAIWETEFNLLIEKTDTDYIKIVPEEILQNPVDGEENSFGEIIYRMEPIIIYTKDISLNQIKE